MKMRLPATPIINIDPYFSVWTEDSVLRNTVHWTGEPNSMSGRVFVDGEEYHFFGLKTSEEAVPDMEIESTEADAFSTFVSYTNGRIRLNVRFTSPMLPDDLYYASRPVAYCKASYKSLDGKPHRVSCRFTASEELVLNKRGEGRAVAEAVSIDGIAAVKLGNEVQNPLWRSGDSIRIDWGYLYLAVCGQGKAEPAELDGMSAILAEAELNDEALFLFAYDDIYSIRYFGEDLEAYWKKGGKTAEAAIAEAANDYVALTERCDVFSDRLKKDAIACGSEKYAELLLLAVRQVMAAHKLVEDREGNLLYISKECFSNGCAATVDVTYPSAPMFLLYHPELLKGMLRPVMRYAASEEWCFDYAPHDVGQYPLVNGQEYGVKRADGRAEIDGDSQMPVEECGNMLILFSAICDAENSTAFAEQYLDTIRQWSKYLIRYGKDPENQLCTDDFAGHLAHNVNLSIKAIMGIAGYGRMMDRLGNVEEAESARKTAREYAESLLERAANADGSYRLAYNCPDTFSLKYNAVWDKLWHTGLFPESFYEGEIARYKREMLPYGVPLDSREKYTKSDWLVWAASLAESREDFDALTDSLWSAYHTMSTRVPMTDWYDCDSGNMHGFRHRSVQGGLFMKLLFR